MSERYVRRMGKGEDGLSAYYYDFTATGDDTVDSVLRVVAGAGVSFHNTEAWTTGDEYRFSPTECIQIVANEAAADLATLRAEVEELRKDRERLNSLVRRTQPLVRSLAHSSRYPNSAVVSLLNEIDAAIEAAKGGE